MLNLKNILDKIKNNLSEEINTEIICSFNKESSLLENSENVIQSRNEIYKIFESSFEYLKSYYNEIKENYPTVKLFFIIQKEGLFVFTSIIKFNDKSEEQESYELNFTYEFRLSKNEIICRIRNHIKTNFIPIKYTSTITTENVIKEILSTYKQYVESLKIE